MSRVLPTGLPANPDMLYLPVQFGPNCTTFLLAGELYPTDVRTTAHGMSAGVAKLGALWVSPHKSMVLRDGVI
jgi:hypothetical protein